uniref:Putative secreted protein n=1 Tax=Anopheles marajoara TaxID=58244 RepID=A0A2M4CB71_9DIPT
MFRLVVVGTLPLVVTCIVKAKYYTLVGVTFGSHSLTQNLLAASVCRSIHSIQIFYLISLHRGTQPTDTYACAFKTNFTVDLCSLLPLY